MKFFHLSDLHIGKHLHYYNLKEDQTEILSQVIEAAKRMRPDAVIIAGDIYDKSAPSAEAVSIFNWFLTALSDIKPAIPVLIISGNHDSSERLEYASAILKRNDIYIAGMPPQSPQEYLKKAVFEDVYGKICVYLLPFVKPGYVRHLFAEQEEAVESYEDAVRKLIEREEIDTSCRNIIVSHQFYTSKGREPLRSDSEMITVGGIDNVDIAVLDSFDYAALGHIHRAQTIGGPSKYYCGTLLKYSVSESESGKHLTMVELGEKGSSPIIREIPLSPIRDVRQKTGLLEDILAEGRKENAQDYVSITITDEREPYKPRERLLEVYSRILEVKAENTRTRKQLEEAGEGIDVSDPLKVFGQFFKEMQGRDMDEEERTIMTEIIHQAEE